MRKSLSIQRQTSTWSGSITNSLGAYSHLVSHFITKTVSFKFRGIDFLFGLSQGLFSSVEIDSGTRLLLKVFSKILDADQAAGKPLPVNVLDSGCGAGVIGICAASAIRALGGMARVRCQDRDELARLITVYNAVMNHIPIKMVEAYTEPLLAGKPSARWDLILTNIPAKAGKPVLEDFVTRSVNLLNDGGRVIIVAVQTLADFLRKKITETGARIEYEEKSHEHLVLACGGSARTAQAAPDITIQKYAPVSLGTGFMANYPFYRRATVNFEAEGVPLAIDTVHGAPGFDRQSAAERAAITLLERICDPLILKREPNSPFHAAGSSLSILIHEPGQGFLPCWLHIFLCGINTLYSQAADAKNPAMVFSGRNILALEAARHNYERCGNRPCVIVPAADLKLGAESLHNAAAACAQTTNAKNRQFSIIITFPELLPHNCLPKDTDQFAALWESIPPLLCSGGVLIIGFNSTDAQRFDRKKPAGFIRLGNIKRDGFKALAYSLINNG